MKLNIPAARTCTQALSKYMIAAHHHWNWRLTCVVLADRKIFPAQNCICWWWCILFVQAPLTKFFPCIHYSIHKLFVPACSRIFFYNWSESNPTRFMSWFGFRQHSVPYSWDLLQKLYCIMLVVVKTAHFWPSNPERTRLSQQLGHTAGLQEHPAHLQQLAGQERNSIFHTCLVLKYLASHPYA